MPLPSREDISVGFRFLAALPRFLRTPLSIEEMRATVRERLSKRDVNFVDRFAEAMRLPDSPYAKLIEHAGITHADVANEVRSDGVDATLQTLFNAGVYLTCDEFKGRRAVSRGSLVFTVDPASLINPNAVIHGLSQTSGSRGPRTPVPIDLAFVRDHAVNTHVALESYGGRTWTHAHHGVPGGTSVTNPLELAKGGAPPAQWFTPIDIQTRGLSPRYKWGVHSMRAVSYAAGVSLPAPTHAPFDDPMPVVRWMETELAAGRTPHLWGFARTAVLICQTAINSGIELKGARFTMGGEPTSAARRATVEAAGAVALPRMGATETDILSFACGNPDAADDMHFFDDRHVLIQPEEGREQSHVPRDAMLLTSLLSSAPVRLLNVCMGDRATTARRICGCGLEREGWTTHICNVRSFEKLTAGGVALLDSDVIKVLEEIMPSQFGGRPVDWQLIERVDGKDARPEIALVVDPSVGPLNDQDVVTTFLAAIGGGDSAERLMELQWRDAGVISVVRETPQRTASGKIQHVASRPLTDGLNVIP